MTRKRILFAAITILISSSIALVAAEQVMRYRRHSIARSDHRDHGLIAYDSRLGWVLSPNWKGRHKHHDFEVSYSTNHYGFRGNFRRKKDTVGRRYAFVGDSFTFSYVVYRVRSWGTNKWVCLLLSLVLPLLPANFVYTVTFWKDIPYTMGLILISLELTRALKQKDYYGKKRNIVIFAILIIFTMSTRYNAPYVLIFSMVTYIIILLVKKLKRESVINAVIIVFCFIIFISSTNIAKAALGDNYDDYDSSTSFYAIPLQGIIAAYNDANIEVTDEQLSKIEKYMYIDEIHNHIKEFEENERWRNFTRTRRILKREVLENDKIGLLKLYAEFFIQNPVIVIRSYFNQTAIIWQARNAGYTSHMSWSILNFEGFEQVLEDIQFEWLHEFINDELNKNQIGYRSFFWHPASMMMIMILLACVGIKKRGIKSLIFILPALFNSLGYMASIEGQCTRYTYVNYTIAIVYFIYILIEDNTKSLNNLKE